MLIIILKLFSANVFNLKVPFKQSFPYMLPHVNYLKINEMISSYPEKIFNELCLFKKINNSYLLYYYRHVLGNNILLYKKI